MAAFAPIPRPSVMITVAARPLARRSERTAIRMSRPSSIAAREIVRINMSPLTVKLYAGTAREDRGNCPANRGPVSAWVASSVRLWDARVQHRAQPGTTDGELATAPTLCYRRDG